MKNMFILAYNALHVRFHHQWILKNYHEIMSRHQAAYLYLYHVKTFCEGAFRDSKLFRRLVTINTTVNNSNSEIGRAHV